MSKVDPFQNVFFKRRSIRRYTSQEVAQDKEPRTQFSIEKVMWNRWT